MSTGDIILGDGVISIAGFPVGLIRGGSFVVEREYRQIEADGDNGPVKDRIRKIRSVAKLSFNSLEFINRNVVFAGNNSLFNVLFPATGPTFLETAPDGYGNIAGMYQASGDLSENDYLSSVHFYGKNVAGKLVNIEIKNAINLENLDLSMVDKEEVVMNVTFTATYNPSTMSEEPWKIQFI